MKDSALAGFYIGHVIEMVSQHNPDAEDPLIIPNFNTWRASPDIRINLGDGMGAWDVDWSLGRSIRGEAGSLYINPQTFLYTNRTKIEGRLDDRGKIELGKIFSISPDSSQEGGRQHGAGTERR